MGSPSRDETDDRATRALFAASVFPASIALTHCCMTHLMRRMRLLSSCWDWDAGWITGAAIAAGGIASADDLTDSPPDEPAAIRGTASTAIGAEMSSFSTALPLPLLSRFPEAMMTEKWGETNKS